MSKYFILKFILVVEKKVISLPTNSATVFEEYSFPTWRIIIIFYSSSKKSQVCVCLPESQSSARQKQTKNGKNGKENGKEKIINFTPFFFTFKQTYFNLHFSLHSAVLCIFELCWFSFFFFLFIFLSNRTTLGAQVCKEEEVKTAELQSVFQFLCNFISFYMDATMCL